MQSLLQTVLLTLGYCMLHFCFTVLTVLPSVLWHCWLGIRKSIQPVKNWMMRCWCGFLNGARWRLFAYGPADATAIQTPRHLSPDLNPGLCTFVVQAYQIVLEESVKWLVVSVYLQRNSRRCWISSAKRERNAIEREFACWLPTRLTLRLSILLLRKYGKKTSLFLVVVTQWCSVNPNVCQ